jgi:hypothetical protein
MGRMPKPDENFRQLTNWAPIVGRWSIDADAVTYQGPQGKEVPLGICVSDARLTEGVVRVTVALSPGTAGRVLLGYRSPTDWYFTAGLGGYGRSYVLAPFGPGQGWRGLSLAGSEANLVPERPYSVRVPCTGQQLALAVDGVRVLEHLLDAPLPKGQTGLFAWGQASVQFSNIAVQEAPGRVFIVMRFADPFQQLYSDVIKPVVEEFGMEAYHVGEVYGPGVILNDIVQGLIESKIVIAEITPANENVFYELGFAHALKKPTILLAEKGRQLPFDITGYRCLFYENTIGGKKSVEESLRKHLQAITHD